MSLNVNNAEFVRSAVKAADFPRDQLPQVVFAGRSNVGKSSVINKLVRRKNLARFLLVSLSFIIYIPSI